MKSKYYKGDPPMKTKNIILISCCFFSVLFNGCSAKDSPPDNVSDGMYTIGCKALIIADKYLDAELTTDEAYDELNSMSSQAHQVQDDDYSDDLSISVSISSLSYDLWDMNKSFGSTKTDVDFKEDRDWLADLLNK